MDRPRRRMRILAWSMAVCVLALLTTCAVTGALVTAGKRSVWLGVGQNYVSIAPRGSFLPPSIDPNIFLVGPALEGRGCAGSPSTFSLGEVAVGLWECRR